MNKYNLITVLLIFFFVKNIDAVILKKEEVLNLNVKDKNNCAEGSYENSKRNGNDFNLCNFHFVCNRNNICSSIPDEWESNEWESDSHGIEFPNANGEIILQKIFGNCTVNSDCVSNECIEDECDNSWDYVTECLTNAKSKKIHCGKVIYQDCNYNEECGSNSCVISEFNNKGFCSIDIFEKQRDTDTIRNNIIIIIILVMLSFIRISKIWYNRKRRRERGRR
ncbi:hypothetical protein PIROE2DRAFT_16447 [Piromyces sp. E2]|nr:hypothetical protein PIROE2DRAFT_16447 [Piromyces sp. E2]|eukprot:OUM58320.1 hypothetical protein PIROE2DRAFT_16447 [Piromyces sp. E2]